MTRPTVEAVTARLAELGVALPPGPVRLDEYGDNPEMSQRLLALIRSGVKRAGTGLLWEYEADDESPGAAGDIEIVLDDRGEPAIVVRLTDVRIVPFGEVTAEYAAIEGEGDGSLEYWRAAHWDVFSRRCRALGREPSEDMPVVCVIFDVLETVGA